jgi:hypothetical protein
VLKAQIPFWGILKILDGKWFNWYIRIVLKLRVRSQVLPNKIKKNW